MALRTSWCFQTTPEFHFGPGAIGQLGNWATRAGFQRLLIVTDPVLRDAGIVEQATAPLRRSGREVVVFDGGEAEPSLTTAERAVDFAREAKPDAIIALGGGSNIDLAKITALLVRHGGAPQDYFGFDRIPGPILPLVAVPTTAGTGSEVSHAAVLTDAANAMKVSTLSRFLRPSLAIVDPDLTLSCPPRVTAASGIDALTHAIEAYTAVDFSHLDTSEAEALAYEGSHPLGDCLAEKAISLIGRSLAIAVQEPENRSARHDMALAASLAGMAFSNCGVALVHALEYPLGAAVHCSHGDGNGLLLPYVMQFNLPARQAKFARIAALLGCNVTPLDEAKAAAGAIIAVAALKQQIGIPQRLRELGATQEQLPEFAEKAFAVKRLMSINPRPPSQEDLLSILKNAF